MKGLGRTLRSGKHTEKVVVMAVSPVSAAPNVGGNAVKRSISKLPDGTG